MSDTSRAGAGAPASVMPINELLAQLLGCVNSLLVAHEQPKLDPLCLDADGMRRRIAALVNEVVAQRKQRARAQEQLDLALFGSRQAIWDADMETGRVALSEHWESLLGRAPRCTELPLMDLLDWVHPDDRDGARLAMLRLVKSPDDEPSVHEHRVRHASGEWIWISSFGKVTRRAADGYVLRVTGVNSDITHRKTVETELVRQLATAHAILEAMPIPLAITNTDRCGVQTNRAWKVPRPSVDEPGQAVDCDPRIAATRGLEGADRHVLDSGMPLRLRQSLPDAGGGAIDLQVDKAPVYDDRGAVSAVVTVTSDLTDLAAASHAAAAAERLKEGFVAMISHELRTPLTSIQGALDLLTGPLAPHLPQRVLPVVAVASAASVRMGRLIDDLLDIESIKRGRLRLMPEALDLFVQADQAAQAHRIDARRLGVELVLDAPAAPAVVLVDADRVQQVFGNLITNAIKHSAPGASVRIAVRASGCAVRVAVSDNGPGVPAELRPRLFEKFAQAAHDPLLRARGGLGLGLAISRALIEQQGGHIGYDDAPAGGAVFWFELPRCHVAPASGRPAAGVARRAD